METAADSKRLLEKIKVLAQDDGPPQRRKRGSVAAVFNGALNDIHLTAMGALAWARRHPEGTCEECPPYREDSTKRPWDCKRRVSNE